ncbi:hypothetical protein [Arthrobacter sp. SDTb3-6]|uniref:hypothetical protein n=1 Tax=Arthrobacter sp. SDTb3-6 TaxID=2713571 RepID=UPI00159D2CEB|nr:hypothetical protein [Arthrobacter sp. SDTb3-6]NVN00401.1 hypothetical protein [Arthrobacter sp. SDTb3-6]
MDHTRITPFNTKETYPARDVDNDLCPAAASGVIHLRGQMGQDPDARQSVHRAMGKWLKGIFPVSTGSGAGALSRTEWLAGADAAALPTTSATTIAAAAN